MVSLIINSGRRISIISILDVLTIVSIKFYLPAEKVQSLGKDWHRPCLKCTKCKKTLTSGGHAEVLQHSAYCKVWHVCDS